jgi:hypothetical protein
MRLFADAAAYRAWRALNCDACAQRQACDVNSILTMAVAFGQDPPPDVLQRSGIARFASLCRIWPCSEFVGDSDGLPWDIEEYARQIDVWPKGEREQLTPTRKVRVPQWLCDPCEGLVGDVLARVVAQMERAGRSMAEIAVVHEVRALLVRARPGS